MWKNDREGKVGGGTLVAIVAVFILAFAFLVWGLGVGHTWQAILDRAVCRNQPYSIRLRLQLTAPQERQPERRANASQGSQIEPWFGRLYASQNYVSATPGTGLWLKFEHHVV